MAVNEIAYKSLILPCAAALLGLSGCKSEANYDNSAKKIESNACNREKYWMSMRDGVPIHIDIIPIFLDGSKVTAAGIGTLSDEEFNKFLASVGAGYDKSGPYRAESYLILNSSNKTSCEEYKLIVKKIENIYRCEGINHCIWGYRMNKYTRPKEHPPGV